MVKEMCSCVVLKALRMARKMNICSLNVPKLGIILENSSNELINLINAASRWVFCYVKCAFWHVLWPPHTRLYNFEHMPVGIMEVAGTKASFVPTGLVYNVYVGLPQLMFPGLVFSRQAFKGDVLSSCGIVRG